MHDWLLYIVDIKDVLYIDECEALH